MSTIHPCRVCGTQSHPFADRQQNRSYHQCPMCDYIFLDPDHRLSETDERQRYTQHNNTLDNPGYVKMFTDFIDTGLTPFLSGARTVLDFGCGPGPVLAHLLRERGMSVDLYDTYFYPDTGYTHKRYDIITMTEVIEHLADPAGTLRNLSSLLSSGGVIAIMTHFYNGNIDTFLNWWYRLDNTHIGFFSHRTFRVLADRCGCDVIFTDKRKICILRGCM